MSLNFGSQPVKQFDPHGFTETQLSQLFFRLRQTEQELLYDIQSGQSEVYRYDDAPQGNILGVAHCDYVPGAWSYPTSYDNRTKVRAGQVDDRVGVWLLLDVLRDLPGMPAFDVLLTTDEEIGRSTAQEFARDWGKAGADYNWCFQFDRRGSDWVDYDKASDDFRRDFTEITGIKHGQGSFSDICYLPRQFGSRANIGTGYHNEHSPDAYVDLGECWDQVTRFVEFAALAHDCKYPMRKEIKRVYSASYGIQPQRKRTAAEWDAWLLEPSPKCGPQPIDITDPISPIEADDIEWLDSEESIRVAMDEYRVTLDDDDNAETWLP